MTRVPSRKPDLVSFPAMIDGDRIETADLAYDTAVELSADALERPAADIAEPLHDALSRLGALSDAGKLGKIS